MSLKLYSVCIFLSTLSRSQFTGTTNSTDLETLLPEEQSISGDQLATTSTVQIVQDVMQCSFPSIVVNGSNVGEVDKFSHITSILFNVEEDGRSLQCKLECREGQWIGPVCNGENFKYGCFLKYISPNVETFHEHVPVSILDKSLLFSHGTRLRFRCMEESMYLEGMSTALCQESLWTNPPPICLPTSSREDYSDKFPPRLEWEVSGSPYSRGREGEIIMYPGSILHIDCIFDRRKGTPQWSWSHSYRDYPTGWLVDEKERNWKFRISLVYAKQQDSGSFNCTTPRGLHNAMVIRVTDQTCPDLQPQDFHRMSSYSTHIGAEVSILCPTGFVSLGSSVLTCRDDGTWSAPLPQCIPVTCPALEISSQHLRVLNLNNTYLGEAEFDCPFGYNLTGDKSIWCNQDGEWSAGVPDCKAITCGEPVPPMNGQMLGSGKYYVGSTVQVVCHSGFVLVGEPLIRCTQSGLWSDATPICKRACSYPGTPTYGSIFPLKFIYSVGEKVKVDCDNGAMVIGESSIECLPSGEWSASLPKCESYL